MSDKIKVTITATERVRYRRTVDMPRDDYDRYLEMVAMSARGIDVEFGPWLDGMEPDDGDGVEDVEVSPYVPKKGPSK